MCRPRVAMASEVMVVQSWGCAIGLLVCCSRIDEKHSSVDLPAEASQLHIRCRHSLLVCCRAWAA